MPHLFDIAVLGATPAGLAAAYALASRGCDVVVIDAPGQSTESSLCDWAPKDLFKLPGLPKTLLRDSGAGPFSAVAYYNAALGKRVEHPARGVAGYFVTARDLAAALSDSARHAGVRIQASSISPELHLLEDHIESIGSTRIRARLLLAAQNQPRDVIGELALPVRTLPHSALVVAGLDMPIRPSAAKKLAGTLNIVELPERSELGMFFAFDEMVHLRLISASSASGTRAAELSGLLTSLQAAGALPGDLRLAKAKGAVWYPPAGVALELESHVAKRCLLAGTAGGFAETITGQTLYPSVKSALLACEVALAALKARDVQEALMAFKTSWRRGLADYLRPPNTSLRMLLPLLFVNQRILAKFTRALLYGENI